MAQTGPFFPEEKEVRTSLQVPVSVHRLFVCALSKEKAVIIYRLNIALKILIAKQNRSNSAQTSSNGCALVSMK